MDASTLSSSKEEISEGRYFTNISSPSSKLSSNKTSHVKNKQIPGISFILIQSKRDELSNNKRTIQYDCVLCDVSKSTLMNGTAMKAHVTSRKHLLNVLEIENNEKYKIYKNDEMTTNTTLYTEICNCPSSIQRIITTPENHKTKRKILSDKVLQLRKDQSSFPLNITLDIEAENTESIQNNYEIIPEPSEHSNPSELSNRSEVYKPSEVPEPNQITNPKNMIRKEDRQRIFDQVVIFMRNNYAVRQDIFLRDKVYVIVLNSSSCFDASEIMRHVQCFSQRTLLLLHHGIYDIARNWKVLNRSSSGCSPISVIKPIQDKQTDVLCDAWHLRHLINEIRSRLSPGSAICILPPPPLIILNCDIRSEHLALQNFVSKEKKIELYLAKTKDIEIFKNTFTRYSEELISIALSEFSKCGISSQAFQNYNNVALRWKFHLESTTYQKIIKNNGVLPLNKYQMWLNSVNAFILTCLGHKITSDIVVGPQEGFPNYEDSLKNEKSTVANNFKLSLNIEKLCNKIPFKHVYIVGKKNLNSALDDIRISENVEFVQWQEAISRKKVPLLIKQMGKIKHKSVCLLALDLFCLANETVSPDCKRLKCKDPISVMTFSIEEEDIDELAISSFLLNKMMEVMAFVSRITPYFPVVILPLFPVRIFLKRSARHETTHSVSRTDSYIVDDKKENWNLFDKLAREFWSSYIKSNNEKYFVAEELQELITEICKESLISSELVNNPSLTYPEISKSKHVLEIILKILVCGSDGMKNSTISTYFKGRQEESYVDKKLLPTKVLVLGDSEAKVFQDCTSQLLNKYNIEAEVKFQEGWTLCDIFLVLQKHFKNEYEVVLLFGLTHFFWKMEKFSWLSYGKVLTPLTDVDISKVPTVMDKIVKFCKSVNKDVLVYLVLPSLKNAYLYNDIDSKTSHIEQGLLKDLYNFHLYKEAAMQEHCKKMYFLISELETENYMWENKLLLNANFAFDEFHMNEADPPQAKFLQDKCTIRELKLSLLHDGFHYRNDFVDFFFRAHAPMLSWLRMETIDSSVSKTKIAIVKPLQRLTSSVKLKVSDVEDPVNKINQFEDTIRRGSLALNVEGSRYCVNSVRLFPPRRTNSQQSSNTECTDQLDSNTYPAGNVEVTDHISCILPSSKSNPPKLNWNTRSIAEAKHTEHHYMSSASYVIATLKANSQKFLNPRCSEKLDSTILPTKNVEEIRENNFESRSCILPALKSNASSYLKDKNSDQSISKERNITRTEKISTSDCRSVSRNPPCLMSYTEYFSNSSSSHPSATSSSAYDNTKLQVNNFISSTDYSKPLVLCSETPSTITPTTAPQYSQILQDTSSIKNPVLADQDFRLDSSLEPRFEYERNNILLSGFSGPLNATSLVKKTLDNTGEESNARQPISSVWGDSQQCHNESQPLTSHIRSEEVNIIPGLTQSGSRTKRSRSRTSSANRNKKHRSGSPRYSEAKMHPRSHARKKSGSIYSSENRRKEHHISSRNTRSGSESRSCSKSYDCEASYHNLKDPISDVFSVEGTLTLLEQISPKLGVLGPAMMAIVCLAKKQGTNSTKTLNLLADEENIKLVNIVINKLKTLLTSHSSTDISVFTKAIDWLSKLLEFVKAPSQPMLDLNIKAIANATLNKSAEFILNLIKSAFMYKEKHNPTKEELNAVYVKVCELHFKMT